MAFILCDAAECRHNGQGQCMLDRIVVAPGAVAVVPETLQGPSRLDDGPWLPGYSSEFEAYRDYAESHPETLASGALCRSYAP